MFIDLSYLTAYDPGQVDAQISELELMQLASNMLGEVNVELAKLPKEFTVDGNLIEIPQVKPVLPREKHLPEEKKTTKWQQFALDRGIKKRKRDRFVYDPKTGEERPRFGKGRTTANSKLQDPVIEVKDRTVTDPFGEERAKKRERIEKNQKQQQKNIRYNQRAERAKQVQAQRDKQKRRK